MRIGACSRCAIAIDTGTCLGYLGRRDRAGHTGDSKSLVQQFTSRYFENTQPVRLDPARFS